MATRHEPSFDIGHPAPDKDRVSSLLLLVGFLGGPIAWSLQLLAGSGVAGAMCIGGDGSRLETTGTDWTQPLIIAVNVAALALALVALAVSYFAYSRTGHAEPSSHGGVMDAGEGRTRFLAIWAIWTSMLFAIAIAFDTVAFFWTGLCGI